jgi:PhzF family phenazine biosynthesis protein
MRIKIYQVDAFTDRIFGGNPAAVCPLGSWLEETLMQHIAMENNLAETAFYVRGDRGFVIRWFTPTMEVDLCGHATLASAHVLFNHENLKAGRITFRSGRSGLLQVSKNNETLTLDFPADEIRPFHPTPELITLFPEKPEFVFKGRTDLMLVYENASQVEKIAPDFERIRSLKDCRGLIVTAPGVTTDFVSRFFAPQSGINEDPVTGSAHTTLAPYWCGRLGKSVVTAIQVSERRGYLTCEVLNERVLISGQAKTYMEGEIIM